MDFMSQLLMEQFNKLGARPIVYNTYQMYMIGAGDRVRRDLDHAQQSGYTFGAKVVRGAYLVGEVRPQQHPMHDSPLLDLLPPPSSPRGKRGKGKRTFLHFPKFCRMFHLI